MRTYVRVSERTTNQKGAIAEEMVSLEAIRLGCVVSRPNTDARYDLIVDTGAQLLRVQCKWISRRRDVLVLSTRGSWFSPGRGYVRSQYAAEDVDAIAGYCEETGRCYVLPAALAAGQSQFHLRLDRARNGQRVAVHWAAEFEFPGAIAQLEERIAGSDEVVGSSPTSSTPRGPAEVIGCETLRDRFGEFMQRAARGDSFAVTYRGRPRARRSPAPGPRGGSACRARSGSGRRRLRRAPVAATSAYAMLRHQWHPTAC